MRKYLDDGARFHAYETSGKAWIDPKHERYEITETVPDYFNEWNDISGWRSDGGRCGSASGFHRCDACGKCYSWRSSYQRHLREECGKEPKATCQNCGKQYRWRDSLNKHLKNECVVRPRCACSVCGRTFRHNQTLTTHLKRGHCVHAEGEPGQSKPTDPYGIAIWVYLRVNCINILINCIYIDEMRASQNFSNFAINIMATMTIARVCCSINNRFELTVNCCFHLRFSAYPFTTENRRNLLFIISYQTSFIIDLSMSLKHFRSNIYVYTFKNLMDRLRMFHSKRVLLPFILNI